MRAPGGGDSGVVVLVPEAERAVGTLRATWDESAAAGVPAHVTLLYPFVPSHALDERILVAVEEALAPFAPFAFELRRTARFDGSVLYLAPEPAAPFEVMTAALAARFPDYPPYRGRHAVVVPHLTVADRPEAPLDRLEAEVRALLPVTARARVVAVVAQDPSGRWRTRQTVQLRGPAGPAAAPPGQQRRPSGGGTRRTR